MKIGFELNAEFRDDAGKGASRRQRLAGKVPAILYGGHRDPRALSLNHEKLILLIENEKFFSSIISLKVGEGANAREVQMTLEDWLALKKQVSTEQAEGME